jgi:hypothetical protein
MPNNSTELTGQFVQLEQQLLEPSTRRDPNTLALLLTEDFREIGVSGRIFTKQQIIDELANESPRHLSLSNPVCRQLAEGVVLLNYRSTRTIPLEPAIHANRSSLWVYRDGRWQMVFHQGTRL